MFDYWGVAGRQADGKGGARKHPDNHPLVVVLQEDRTVRDVAGGLWPRGVR